MDKTKKINWEDVASDVVFALALLQVAVFNWWGVFVVLPVAIAQALIARSPKNSVYKEGGWIGFASLLGWVIVGDMFLNIVFETMIPTQHVSVVAVMAAILVVVYSAIKTAWGAANQKKDSVGEEESLETTEEESSVEAENWMIGRFRDENGRLVVCLGLIEDGMAIVYDQNDPEAKTYSVFAGNLVKVD